MDTFICGTCETAFNDLQDFVNHKNNGCHFIDGNVVSVVKEEVEDDNVEDNDGLIVDDTGDQGGDEATLVVIPEDQESMEGELIQVQQIIQSEDGETFLWTENHISHDDVKNEEAQEMQIEASVVDMDTFDQQQEEQVAEPLPAVHLVPVNTESGAVDLQILVQRPQPPTVKKSGKKRGRPRKSEQKPKEPSQNLESNKKEKSARPELPSQGPDGMYHCTRCKKPFRRERHYNTHVCLADTDYVDYNQKEVKIDLDLFTDDEEETEDKDPTVEFNLTDKANLTQSNPGKKRGRGRPRKVYPLKPQPQCVDSASGSLVGIIPSSGLKNNEFNLDGPIIVRLVQERTEKDDVGEAVMSKQTTDEVTEATISNDNVEESTITNENIEEATILKENIEEITISKENLEDSSISKDEMKDPNAEQPGTDENQVINPLHDSELIADPRLSDAKPAEPTVMKFDSFSELSKFIGGKDLEINIVPITSSSDISGGISDGTVVLSNISGDKETTEEQLRKLLFMEPEADFSEKIAAANIRTFKKKRPVKKVSPSDESKKIIDIPVFTNEEDKLALNNALNVDLSVVDHLFVTHVISQDINESAPPVTNRQTADSLSVFSCSQCQKVYMSMSHARLHCVIHTDLKPFKCFKCDFATNTKGNLYSHMRKHTGQMYRCPHCDFVTSNKGHLIEHEEIHSTKQHECELCKKLYSTSKSLGNHVKKYHNNTEKGRKYMETFMKRRPHGPALLHMCQVCNRKFKKKSDRDRHLLVHNIRDGIVFECGLCDYVTSRKNYLLNHARKHRVIFVCCQCDEWFPSSKKLHTHSCAQQLEGNDSWNNYFEKCLEVSKYLPDDSIEEAMEEQAELDDPETSIDISSLLENPKGTVAEAADIKQTSNADETSASAGDEVITCQSAQTPGQAADEANSLMFLVRPGNGFQQKLSLRVSNKPNDEDMSHMTKEINEDDPKAASLHIIADMAYQPLTKATFQLMRDTYGNEECEFCGRLFITKSEYEVHVKTHTGEKPYGCEMCNFRAITRENLKRHVERDHEKTVFTCSSCEFETTTRSQLWMHELSHKDGPTVTCLKCNVSFDNQRKMRVHLSMKHPELAYDEKKKVLDALAYPTTRPGRKSYKCPFCSKVFHRANSELQKHMWIHQGLKPFKCPVCPHACRSKHNLNAHMLRHSQEKPFLCNQCGKAYKSRTALRWHVRSHKDGKIFKCHKCPYEGTQQAHLTRHLETHNIAKKFTCQHCDFSSNTLGYMKIHYTRQHKGHLYSPSHLSVKETAPDAKVYRCLSCDYLFGNLSDMKRHLKIRHHIQVEDMGPLDTLEPKRALEQTQQMEADQQVELVQLQEGEVQGALQYTQQPQASDHTQLLQQIFDLQSKQSGAHVLASGIDADSATASVIIDAGDGREGQVVESGGGEYVIQYEIEADKDLLADCGAGGASEIHFQQTDDGRYVQVLQQQHSQHLVQIQQDEDSGAEHHVTYIQSDMLPTISSEEKTIYAEYPSDQVHTDSIDVHVNQSSQQNLDSEVAMEIEEDH